jgi:hypothetical protein
LLRALQPIHRIVSQVSQWTLLGIFVLFLLKQVKPTFQVSFGVFIFVFLLANAISCGVFSGAFPRYQSRVVWMAALSEFLLVRQFLEYRGLAAGYFLNLIRIRMTRVSVTLSKVFTSN